MKIQKINTGIIITKTAKQPSAKIEFSLDELDALSEFCESELRQDALSVFDEYDIDAEEV